METMAAVKAFTSCAGTIRPFSPSTSTSGTLPTRDTKLALLDAANVFVLPSHVEALPVSMLEAMAYGLAAVVSRVGSVPEVLVDGENGLMVPAQDVNALTAAMETMATQVAQRRQVGALGRQTVAQGYAVKGVCAELEALYRRLRQPA
jgi:glycosyltransferase involved in cell wall biosynthesis